MLFKNETIGWERPELWIAVPWKGQSFEKSIRPFWVLWSSQAYLMGTLPLLALSVKRASCMDEASSLGSWEVTWTPGSEESTGFLAEKKVTSFSLIKAHTPKEPFSWMGALPLTFHFLGMLYTWPMTEAAFFQVRKWSRASQSLESRSQDA